MVKATKSILGAALFAGSCTIAMAQGAGGEPPKGSDANPPAAGMQQKNTNMPAGPNNSTGNMNTKGTGMGTTGTGGTGGSGNC